MYSIRIFYAALCFAAVFFNAALPASALDLAIAPSMQSCSTDAECTVANGQCGNSCSFVPLNSKYQAALETQRTMTCGAAANTQTGCVTVPALTASCIHSRCTIGTAYQEHADAKDYGSQRAPSAVANMSTAEQIQAIAPASGGDDAPMPRSGHADRSGFTAYDLPDQGQSTVMTLGVVAR